MSLNEEQFRQYTLACVLMEERIGALYIQGLSEEEKQPQNTELIAALVAERKAIFYERRDLRPDDSEAVAEAIRKYRRG